MSTLIVIVLLLSFVGMLVYLIRGGNPLLTMLVMAILWAFLGGYNVQDVVAKTIAGTFQNNALNIIIVMMGAWFSQAMVQTGIASSLIKSAVELGGDRPKVVVSLIMAVVAFLFISMYGVGPTIAVGVIVIPIMLSMGIQPRIAVAALCVPIGLSSAINIAQFNVVAPLFPKIATFGTPYTPFAFYAFGAGLIIAIIGMNIILSKNKPTRAWALSVETNKTTVNKIPWFAFLTPIIPVVTVMVFKLTIIAAFLCGILYAVLTTYKKINKKHFGLITKTFSDGLADSGTMILYMLSTWAFAGSAKVVAPILLQSIGGVLPTTKIGVVLMCGLLAPLVIYRGPISLMGSGVAIYTGLLATGLVPATFVWVVAYTMEAVHYQMDPTNSTVVWAMSYTKLKPTDYLKTVIPMVWVIACVALAFAYFMV